MPAEYICRKPSEQFSSAEFARVKFFATRKEAAQAAKLISWSNANAYRVIGRFQIGWGLRDVVLGYLTEKGYDFLLEQKVGPAGSNGG